MRCYFSRKGKAALGCLLLAITIPSWVMSQTRVGIGTTNPDSQLHIETLNSGLLIRTAFSPGNQDFFVLTRLQASRTSSGYHTLVQYQYSDKMTGDVLPGVPMAGWSEMTSNARGMFVGTTSEAPFILTTRRMERMRLHPTGGITIGAGSLDPSAALQIHSNTQGLIIPRLTTAERNAIANPANGLMIFNLTTGHINYHKTTGGWQELTQAQPFPEIPNAWLANGNMDAPANAVLGTFNDVPLRLRVFDQRAGMLGFDTEANTFLGYASGNHTQANQANTGFGTSSLSGITSGQRNTAVGTEAGFAVSTGQRNTFVGRQAGWQTTTQSGNVALGAAALYHAKGSDHIAIGDSAYFGAASGTAAAPNIAIGKRALASASNAASNVVIGRVAFSNVTTGTANTILGNGAFSSNASTNGGQHNIALGANAMFSANGGNFNIAMNNLSLRNNTGDHNIALGAASLWNNASGNRNIALGNFSLQASTTASQQIAIGDSALYTYNGSEEGNVAIGGKAGWQLTNNGTQNTMLGRSALKDGLFTNRNVAIGFDAGNIVQGGGSNVFVGHSASAKNNLASGSIAIGAEASAGFTNSAAIGFQASVTGSNRMAFGNENVANWIFGRTIATAGRALEVGTNNTNGNGAYLTAGGTWTNNSDINLKEDIQAIDGASILSKIAALPITRWKYKGTGEYHIGPMAQDFFASFGTGVDDKSISSIDPAGVALAAIKALIEKNEKLEKEIANLKQLLEK